MRLHSATIPTDLEAIAAASSILANRDVLAEQGATLRAGLRLARSANRYAAHDHSTAVGAALRTLGAPL